jgi:hypothetical protein
VNLQSYQQTWLVKHSDLIFQLPDTPLYEMNSFLHPPQSKNVALRNVLKQDFCWAATIMKTFEIAFVCGLLCAAAMMIGTFIKIGKEFGFHEVYHYDFTF